MLKIFLQEWSRVNNKIVLSEFKYFTIVYSKKAVMTNAELLENAELFMLIVSVLCRAF